MEILNLTSSSANNSYSYDNNNLFFKLSIAESQLKEYFKEESLIKAVNIIKEILSSKEIEKNLKNILNTLLSKIMECYTRCDNKTRFIINHIIFINKKKFSNIFLNKDVINYLNAVVTCSDTIARGYSLQLITYLPALIEKRLDLLHTTFDLFINEKVPYEEKLIILELYKEHLLRDSQTKINLVSLLIDNLESILSFKNCRNSECAIKYCEVCFNFRYKAILLYRVIGAMRTDIVCAKLADGLKAYILKRFTEYFKISGYILLLIKSIVSAGEFSSFVNSIKRDFVYDGFNPSLSSYNVGLSLAYVANFLDFEQEKSIHFYASNFDVFKMLFDDNPNTKSQAYLQLQSAIDKNFFLACYLSHIFKYKDAVEVENSSHVENTFQIKKINFSQFIKTLITIIELNSQFSQTIILNEKFKIDSRNFKRFVNYFKSNQINLGLMRSPNNFFENHKNVEDIINILKQFRNDNEIGTDIITILTNNLHISVKDFKTRKEFHNYFYLLCSCIKNQIDSKQFEEILLAHYPLIKNSEISNFVLKGIIKYQLRYTRNNSLEQIEKLSGGNNFLTLYYIFKEYFISHKIKEAKKVLQHDPSTINNPLATNFLNKVLSLKFQILNQVSLISTGGTFGNEADLIQLSTQLDDFSQERILFFEKSKKILSQFSINFLSNPIQIIKNLFNLAVNLSQNSIDKHKTIMNNLTNTSLVIWLTKDNKLSEIIDLKLNQRRNDLKLVTENIKSLILHYSKYLLVINPPLDILIKYEAVKDKHDRLYKIGIKIKMKNIGDYFKCSQDASTLLEDNTYKGNIFCSIYANGCLKKKESFDAVNNYKDVDFIFENERGQGHEDVGLGIKLQFYLIYNEFFIFHFYESAYSYTFGK